MQRNIKSSMIASCIRGMRDLRILDRRKPWRMLSRAATAIGLSYLHTIVLAVIVDSLTAGASAREILTAAGIGVSAIFVGSILSHGLECKDQFRDADLLRAYRGRKSRKLLKLPYERLEGVDTRETLSRMHMQESIGFGLSTLIQHFNTLIKALLSTAVSLIMLAALLVRAGKGPLDYVWMLLFGAATTFLSLAAAYLIKRANDASMKALQSVFSPHIILNDYLTSGGGIRYPDGKDIRFYRYQPQIETVYGDAVQEMRKFDRTGGTLPALAAGLGGAVRGLTLGASYLFVLLVWQIGYRDLGWALVLASSLYQLSSSLAETAGIFSQCSAAADSVHAYMQFTKPEEEKEAVCAPGPGRRNEEGPGEEHLPFQIAGADGVHREESVSFADASFADSTGDAVLRVKRLSFRYPGAEKETLRDISFTIPKGGRIALVGLNGSGKTTLVKLLCGLYQPHAGRILLEGKDLSQYSSEEYGSHFSVVFQDFKLFSLPLGETIASAGAYDGERVQKALDQAGLGERLPLLPDGLETYLYKDFADGVELSGGEAQKAALARALYRDAPILVLDEPTAALDPLSEAEIYDRVNRLSRDKSILFVSHRMSACRFCDEILVLAQGELVQKGRHEELLAQEGPYRRLWQAQAQYYQDSDEAKESIS